MQKTKFSAIIPAFLLMSLLVAVIYGIWQWNQLFEIIEYDSISLKPKTKLNPLFAAEVFLAKQHHEVESSSSANYVIDQHPTPNDLIIYTNRSERLSNPQRRDALLAWVKKGGHLIINAIGDNYPDPFLKDLGVHQKLIEDFLEDQDDEEDLEDEDKSNEQNESNLDSSRNSKKENYVNQPYSCVAPETLRTRVEPLDHGGAQCGLLPLDSSSSNSTLNIFSCDDYYLHDDSGTATPAALDEWGLPHMLIYSIGEGSITVINSEDFLSNKQILYFDHALYLSQQAKDRHKIWLIFDAVDEGLWAFLWHHAKLFCATLMLLLIFYLWRNMLRTGPIVAAPKAERRQLMEHLQASANFKWKHQQTHVALQKIQHSILLAAARKQGRNSVDFAKEVAWIATASSLQESEVNAALSANCPENPLEFVALTQTLFSLRTLLCSI